MLSSIGYNNFIKLNKISKYFVSGLISIEDHHFWKHRGINKIRTLKALFLRFSSLKRKEGGSTISQQLSKNLFFNSEKTYFRKFKELLITIQIENKFSKKDILEGYINVAFFASGTYGIKNISYFFFDKQPINLTLSEGSLLAGIPKSPKRYDPRNYPNQSKKRQMIVLKRMLKMGRINIEEFRLAYKMPIHFSICSSKIKINNYFIDATFRHLKKLYRSKDFSSNVTQVFTTMNIKYQMIAENCLENGLRKLDKHIIPVYKKKEENEYKINLQGSIISLDISCAAIRTILGGKKFLKTPFNRGIENNRLSGSGFKPFLYYTGMEKLGITENDIIYDKITSVFVPRYGIWTPKNFDGTFEGPLSLKKAFINSINTTASQIIAHIGPKSILKTANKCGVTSNLEIVYSIALGTSGISPLEMASSFCTIASKGVYKKPYVIYFLYNNSRFIIKNKIFFKKVLNDQICYNIVKMMKNIIILEIDNNNKKKIFINKIAGKTGTTNSYNDAWFTGFTNKLTTSLWIGFDKKYGMRNSKGQGITGQIIAIPMWLEYMLDIDEKYEKKTH